MTRGLRFRVLVASLALVLLVALPFALLIRAVSGLQDASELTSQSQAVATTAQKLERLLLDLQAGQRGFVITGNDEFLEPWFTAREALPLELARLERLVGDPEQRRRAVEIEAGLRSYLEDYSVPLVERARRDRESAAAAVSEGEGVRRVGRLRDQLRAFEDAQADLSERRADRVDEQSRRAIAITLGGLAGSALLVLLFGLYLGRAVVEPIRRTAGSARRLADGDLTARTPRGGPRDVDELAASFNEMAASLELSRDELESQNAELEAQQAELEEALTELNLEQTRLRELYGFAEKIAGKTEMDDLCETALRELCELAGAEVGSLYVSDEDEGDVPCLSATVGLDRSSLPARLPSEGLAARAIAERRVVAAAASVDAPKVAALGRDLTVRHELHLPLVQGERELGVLSLGRLSDQPFSASEQQLLEHLAEQAGVAIANAASYRAVTRLAQINRAVLDATADGIRMVDLEGHTVLTNASMDAMAGAVLQLGDEGPIWDRAAHLADRTADPDAYRRALDAIRADPHREALDEYCLVDTGRWIQRYTAPVRGPGDSVIGRIFVLRDVTREREAEQLKTDLMATVSHELRTPLASILGFSELLAERELGQDVVRRYLRTIHSEAQRLTNLINDFLDLQRIEAGSLRVELASLDLATLLRQTADLYAAQSKNHTIDVAVQDAELTVLADRERIAQVVGNLLSNAIKYSPDGGAVTIAASTTGDSVRVAVNDEGLGIPAAQKSQIFEKFFRVHTSERQDIGGTGLGLALSREIVEAHGGRIGFDSVEGRGSTFWFELPSGRKADGRGRILVIADDDSAGRLLVDWLAADGHPAELATSGVEGLERAERLHPSLICLDIGLSGPPDGWDVLEELKARPATASTPVVVCTADNTDKRASALGAADVLGKPFSAEQLRAAVVRLLPHDGGSLLVVDDDEAVRRLVLETLGREGLRLREAADGAEALAAVADEVPDAIVLDLAMPEVDGFEVLAELGRRPSTRDVPVVVLTGKRLSPAERALLRRRAVSLMEKNAYSALQLRSLIRAALGETST